MKSSYPSWFVISLTLTMLTLVACNSEQPAPTAVPVAEVPAEETAVVEETATALPEPTATLPPTSTPAPTETPMPTSTPEPAVLAEYETAACQFDVPFGLDVTCGYLTVPEDRTDSSNERTIRLHVAIFASQSSNPQPDPIIYLEGGPGGNALQTVPLAFESRFTPFLADRDFIMFDQRGTGFSEPALVCDEVRALDLELIDDDISVEESNTQYGAAITACRERLVSEGVNLNAFDSAQNAADVNDLRLALGIEEWNLYGISYGTRLAQTIMRDHPEGIRSVILDSVYPLEVSLVNDTPDSFNRAFDTFFAACATDPACEAAYPALEARLFALVEQLNEAPIMLPVTQFLTGEQYNALFNGDSLLGLLFQSLYSEQLIPILPELITEVEAGETGQLGLLVSNFLTNGAFFTRGMQWSVQCQEEIPFGTPAEAAAAANAYPEFGDLFRGLSVTGEGAFALCDVWGVETAPAIENEPISSDIPTLLMSGEFDPITPPAWAALVSENLDNNFNYVFPSVGHGSSVADDCPTDVVLQFIGDPQAEPDVSCIAEMEPPAFAPSAPTTAADIVMVPFSDDTFGLEGVAPEGWEAILPGTNARQQDGLDQTVLIQQAVPGLGAAELLGLISEQLQLAETPDSIGAVEAGGNSWLRYEAELQGQVVDLALAEDEQVAYLVLLISDPSERDVLVTAVLLPALEALRLQ